MHRNIETNYNRQNSYSNETPTSGQTTIDHSERNAYTRSLRGSKQCLYSVCCSTCHSNNSLRAPTESVMAATSRSTSTRQICVNIVGEPSSFYVLHSKNNHSSIDTISIGSCSQCRGMLTICYRNRPTSVVRLCCISVRASSARLMLRHHSDQACCVVLEAAWLVPMLLPQRFSQVLSVPATAGPTVADPDYMPALDVSISSRKNRRPRTAAGQYQATNSPAQHIKREASARSTLAPQQPSKRLQTKVRLRATTAPTAATSTTVTPAPALATMKTTTTQLEYILYTELYEEEEQKQQQPKITATTFWQKHGYIFLAAIGVSVCLACSYVVVALIAQRRLVEATSGNINQKRHLSRRRRQQSGISSSGSTNINIVDYSKRQPTALAVAALAIPLGLTPSQENPEATATEAAKTITLLPTEPEHSVPMLSVQTAGCAGMERLGVPTRTSLGTPPDDRDQFRCRMRVDALQARDLLAVRGETVIRSSSNNSSSGSGSVSNQQHHHIKQQHSHHQLYQKQQQQQHMKNPTLHASSANCGSQQQQYPGNSYNNNHSINSLSSSVARDGIETTTLKYGNSSSGCYKGDSSTSTTSSCSSLNSHSNEHHQHYQYQLQQQQTPRCPHHVPLPDSEYGQDRHLQIRSSYQQSEITRSYTKPPPNKTVRDVPEPTAAASASSSSSHRTAMACSPTLHAASTAGAVYVLAAANAQPLAGTTKSKPNAITKFFSRISSPKSPTALASPCGIMSASTSLTASASMSSSASSLASSAGVSTSSSASSLAAAPVLPALPTSNAATLKSTACGFGANAATGTGSSHIYAGLAPSTHLFTSLGTPTGGTTPERIPTPPLSVSVPIGSGLQILKSNSCNLPAAGETSVATTMPMATPMPSISASSTISRNNSNSSMMSCSCNCNNRNCNNCGVNSC